MSVAGAAILCAASASAGEGDCISARYKAAGKYADCETKVAAKEATTGRSFSELFLKCRQKYADTWAKLVAKYPGTSCEGARFVDNGDETITDNLTQLVWEKKTTAVGSGINASDRHDVDNVYSWSADIGSSRADGTAFTDFLDDLNSTGFAGQHDWRLPTHFELQSIIATDGVPCGSAPCVADPLFLPTQSIWYWSSSTGPWLSSLGSSLVFATGRTDSIGKNARVGVRAVRGGF